MEESKSHREARLRAQEKYDKANKDKIKSFLIKCNIESDADIIDKLMSVKSKQAYIKELIRKDIENR